MVDETWSQQPGSHDEVEALEAISELRGALSTTNREAAWNLLLLTEACQQLDTGSTPGERALLRRIKSIVGDLLAARREGREAGDAQLRILLTALEDSICRRRARADLQPRP